MTDESGQYKIIDLPGGTYSVTFTNHNLQTDNLTPELQARGLKYDNKTKVIWDANAAVGGPIKLNKPRNG